MRTEWTAKRYNDPIRTQMHYARKGIVTEEMAYVAKLEKLEAGSASSACARCSSTDSSAAACARTSTRWWPRS